MAKGAEKMVLDLLSHQVPTTTKELQDNLPEEMRGNRTHQAVDRLKRKGMIVPVAGVHPYQYLLSQEVPSFGERLKANKPRAKAPPKQAPGVPMPQQMTKQLNLRIHQKERAISFEVEGWSIRIGFEA